MNYQHDYMPRAADAASLQSLLREFIAEARNVLANLQAIEKACSNDLHRETSGG